MEKYDEQLNIGIKEIKNIKMTDNEKNQILQNIVGQEKPIEIVPKERYSIFQMFNSYSYYMKLAVYFLLLVSVGGAFWFNYKGSNPKVTYTPNNYNNNQNYPLINNTETPIIPKTINTKQTDNTKLATNPNPIGEKSTMLNNNFLSAPAGGTVAVLAPVIVYKTRNDYSNNVSVCYKDDEITCNPGPGDAIHQRPTKLANGYFLKRMSGDVFLNITIDEFINYKGDWSDLIKIKNIIDYHPFTEMYSCPTTFDIEQINQAILNNRLKVECQNIL